MDDVWFENAAKLIHYHRKQSGLSQLELATVAGVGKTAVFDIEHGKTTVQLQTFIKICIALNITVELASPLMENYRASS